MSKQTKSHNVVLTGVPRSGTTLVCHLLNKYPNTVALHEPISPSSLFRQRGIQAMGDEVDRFFQQTRKSLLENGTAISKHVGGRVPDNPATDSYPWVSRFFPRRLVARWTSKKARFVFRKSRISKGSIAIEKPLSSDFLLCIKHPAIFTALLENLSTRYPCYAVVRNPLSALASWNSVAMNVRAGHAPVAERLDPGLAQRLAQINDRLERQLCLLEWFLGKYHALLPSENVLRYEDIVASGASALQVITSQTLALGQLENKNLNRLYDRGLMWVLGEKLLERDSVIWHFYAKASVERLLEETVA